VRECWAYRHVLKASVFKGDTRIGYVDQEISISSADAAITLRDGAFGVGERRRLSDAVLEVATVAGTNVSLARFLCGGRC